MFAEEQFLRKKFGQAYLDWADKTPAFFPMFWQNKKTDLKFSLKNILKREYSGFFGLVFIMTTLRMIGFVVTTKQIYLDTPWVIIFLTAFIIFLSLKMLKKFTKVLEVEGR